MSQLHRVAILLNRAAGTVICRDGRTLGETIAASFARHGITTTLELLSAAEVKKSARRALRQAEKNQIDAVVVGGGDGTIATVARIFAGSGGVRVAYLAILASHTVLAVAVGPLALVTLRRALRGEFGKHRRIARVTLPIWLYVVATGWPIYWMLYGALTP